MQATPSIKVNAVRNFGGNVILHGDNYDEAYEEAMRLSKEEHRVVIHPFDDVDTISGQATIATEILHQMPSNEKIHAVFGAVGGGGMLAGMALYFNRVDPSIKLVGSEARDAAGMTASLEAGEVVTLDAVGGFADGASVRTIGTNTFDVCSDMCDAFVTVSTDEICAAIKAGFNDTRVVLEPAGALGIAGMRRYVQETGIKNETLVAVASGANMDFDRLRFVSERADSSEAMLSVRADEKAGTFFSLYMTIFPRNVTEFSYRQIPKNKFAHILLSFQPKDRETDLNDCVEALRAKGCLVHDYVDNELAKTHVRHLAGGRIAHPKVPSDAEAEDDDAKNDERERLFRFEFPERPGALKVFLERLLVGHYDFNVSLFHYRAHGSDVGRVLCGFTTSSEKDDEGVERFLEDLGFVYFEETKNSAYVDFLY